MVYEEMSKEELISIINKKNLKSRMSQSVEELNDEISRLRRKLRDSEDKYAVLQSRLDQMNNHYLNESLQLHYELEAAREREETMMQAVFSLTND